MAESKYLKKVQGNGASTTLSASMSAVATSASLTADTAFAGEGMVIIDEGQATEEFAYATAKVGSALTTLADDRGLEGGSAQAHASTATVKGIITAGMWNNLITGVTNVLVNTTGALDTTKVVDLTTAQNLSNKTLVAPALGTPASGVMTNVTGTAANLTAGTATVANGLKSATTTVSVSAATAPSANQVLTATDSTTATWVTPTAASADGWTDGSAYTWVYASASTFTIAGVDLTTTFPKGTRLKFTQTTVKYAVVVSSSFSTNTTVTIAVNTDYVIANAAISLNYYSYQLSPQGYPGSFAYTPTLTNLTQGSGTMSFRYAIHGNLVHINGYFAYGSGSSVSGLIGFSLPVATYNSNSYSGTMGTILDSGAAFMPCRVYFGNSSRLDVYALNSAGTYLAEAATSSTVPMTWTTNDAITFDITYIA